MLVVRSWGASLRQAGSQHPDSVTSHDGLDISERDWEIFVKHTIATLDSLEVHGQDREDCLVVVDELADEIVENAKASVTSD